MNQSTNRLGVIGGSGVYQIEGAKVVDEHVIETPFGKPSDPVVEADIDGERVYFIARHGKGHRLLPSEVPYAANVFALKTLGVTHLLAVSAVGIMQDGISPGTMVIPDQLFDRTKGTRQSTFFGSGIVGHVSFADPFCNEMRMLLRKAADKHSEDVFFGGPYICMEGPQFSTRAESQFYRKTVAPSVIGMTAVPEAKLAREAEMSYAMLALATDYDCWKESEEDVAVDAILAVLKSNAEKASSIVRSFSAMIKDAPAPWADAAAMAIITSPDQIPTKIKRELAPLFGKYFDR